MTRAITCTTRAPRPGEKDGVDYHFLDGGGISEAACRRGISSNTPRFLAAVTACCDPNCWTNCARPGRAAERGCAGRGDHPGAGAERAGIETRAGDGVSDAAVAGGAGGAVEKARRRTRRQKFKSGSAVARQEIAQWKNFDYLLISSTIPEDLRRMLAIVEAEKMRVAGRAAEGQTAITAIAAFHENTDFIEEMHRRCRSAWGVPVAKQMCWRTSKPAAWEY